MSTSTSYYTLGNNRVVYKAALFAAGLTVTAKMWDPDLLTNKEFTLTELSDGLYYFAYKFTRWGIYPTIFYEGGTATAFHTIRIKKERDL